MVRFGWCPDTSWASQVGPGIKNMPANAQGERNAGLILGLERSPGGGNDNPLQYSCLENPMDKGAWWATAHGVTKNRILLRQLSTHALTPHSALFIFHPCFLFTQVFDPVSVYALWRTRISKVNKSGILRIWFLDDSFSLASFRMEFLQVSYSGSWAFLDHFLLVWVCFLKYLIDLWPTCFISCF